LKRKIDIYGIDCGVSYIAGWANPDMGDGLIKTGLRDISEDGRVGD